MSCTRLWTKKIWPPAIQFAQHGVANDLRIETSDTSFDGQPIFGRRFQIRDIAHAHQRHVQRARDRRGGHGQHIDGAAQPFQTFLDFHAEPLFFIDDHQSQVVELHVLRRQAVRANDDIDASRRQSFDNLHVVRAWSRSG